MQFTVLLSTVLPGANPQWPFEPMLPAAALLQCPLAGLQRPQPTVRLFTEGPRGTLLVTARRT